MPALVCIEVIGKRGERRKVDKPAGRHWRRTVVECALRFGPFTDASRALSNFNHMKVFSKVRRELPDLSEECELGPRSLRKT
jgi:hypothetical protein